MASVSNISSEMVDQSNDVQNFTAVDDLSSSEIISEPDYSNPNRNRYPPTFEQKHNMKKDG